MQKRFVNRKKKAEGQIRYVRQHLQQLDTQAIREVLEVGCGIGIVSAFLAEEYGMKVTGTDVDPEQIEIARQMLPESDRLHFGVEDATRLTFQDASFDLLVSQFVFHHVAEWERIVQEGARVLVPGGYFMWLDVVVSKVVKRIFQPVMKKYGLYTLNEATSAFAESGFALRCSERFHFGPFVCYDVLLQKS